MAGGLAELKGLFAEAESPKYGEERSTLIALAARVALNTGLIRGESDYGTLADVEDFLRASASGAYLLAFPLADRSVQKHYDNKATYSWLREEDTQAVDPPDYILKVALGEKAANFGYSTLSVTATQNAQRLTSTGLPSFVVNPEFERRLLNHVPPTGPPNR
jgi:hypothetical protein